MLRPLGRRMFAVALVTLPLGPELSPTTLPSLSVNDVVMYEGDGPGTATFTVTLSAPSPTEVDVDYRTVSGTANAGEDFVAVSGSLTFAPGVTQLQVPVTILGDNVYEGNEAFALVLENAVGAVIERAGVAYLLDDDRRQGDNPIMGDWNGDGIDTVGVFRSSTATWYLRDSNTTGTNTIPAFQYGEPGDIPVKGDWDGDGIDTIGVFRPSTRVWYLNNRLPPTPDGEFPPFRWGLPGDLPVAGDWDGNGADSIGVYRPSTGYWYLTDAPEHPPEQVVIPFYFGLPEDDPFVGDWDGDGVDTPGLFRPTTHYWYLSNDFYGTTGVPGFPYGKRGDIAVYGRWGADSGTSDTMGTFRPAEAGWYLRGFNGEGPNTVPKFTYGQPRLR